MGLVSATIGAAIATGQPTVALDPLPVIPDRLCWVKLASDTMRHDRMLIHLALAQVEVGFELDAVIHASILRSFEHQYDI